MTVLYNLEFSFHEVVQVNEALKNLPALAALQGSEPWLSSAIVNVMKFLDKLIDHYQLQTTINVMVDETLLASDGSRGFLP